jgi:hypothetical protein
MTQAQLHAIFMESETAYATAREICAAFGVPFPPDSTDETQIELEDVCLSPA